MPSKRLIIGLPEESVGVRFQPSGKWATVPQGATVREAAALAGIVIDAPCGGQGNCGKCKVRVFGGNSELTTAERTLLSHDQLKSGCRLACQCIIENPVVVETPETSLLASSYKILVQSRTPLRTSVNPPVRRYFAQFPVPTMDDDASDIARLERVTGPLVVELNAMRVLSARIRAGNFSGTAIVASGNLIDFIPGARPAPALVAAFDIGTTTVVGSLLDATTGREIAHASRLNPQTAFGDDILARISAGSDPNKLERLRKDIVDAINAMLEELASHTKHDVTSVYDIAFAGNTTMQHFVLGLDATPIGVAPFVPTVSKAVEMGAAGLGIVAHPNARVYLFPVISAYVGGDTVAGILATQFHSIEEPALFIDIGTNGEMVATSNGRVVAASCAAGPAFEGARIAFGMRATSGAIEAIHLEDDVSYKVIGNVKPIGICGSALIDIAAELLRIGVLTQTGALLGEAEAPANLPPSLRARLRLIDHEHAFVLVEGSDTQTGQPIALLQRDVRELQLATAAVRSGLQIMLKRIGVDIHDLRRVLVAGAFGNYIRCENAQRIGLLPTGIPTELIEFVGNTSLAGARNAIASLDVRALAQEVALRVEHVELSLDPDFQDIYIEAMFFPEPNYSAS